MKTLGIIGGISWFSTAAYYRTINELANQRLGGSHSARIILYSLDFHDFKILQEQGDWSAVERMLADVAQRLQHAGADCILMATNTPHIIADTLQQQINVPLLHIAEETAKEIVRQKIGKVGLLGTKFTMERSFFKGRLAAHGIDVIIPESSDMAFIHYSIINEFTRGIFSKETKKKYQSIIESLQSNGAQGVILGCTEISLLIQQEDSSLVVFDTTAIHSRAAVEFALA